jgi:hypothetical protein
MRHALVLVLLAGCGGKANETAPDASTPIAEAGVPRLDASRPPDAMPPDAGPMTCTGPNDCHPHDVSSFMPIWKPPTSAHQNKCSSQFIDDVWQDCLSPNATMQSCDKWYGKTSDMAHQACVECLFTPETQQKLGPLFTFDYTEDINYAGCLAILDPNELACAQAVQAAQQCGEASCLSSCPVMDIPGYYEYQKCVSLSQTSCGCQPWQQKAACSNTLMGPGQKCFSGNDWHESYTIVANLFCGP